MTNLELKNALNILRAEVVALRDRVGALEARPAQEVKIEPEPKRAMCPKCNKKPNHFFHVKNCTG